jgi:hypothetical protein
MLMANSSGQFRMEDVVVEQPDASHPKRFAEGKHLGLWLQTCYKWLEWGTKRAPRLFSRPTFPEHHEALEKILVQRIPGQIPNAAMMLSGSTLPKAASASFMERTRRRAQQLAEESRALCGREAAAPDLPQREKLEALSRRFAVKYLLA